MPDSTRPTFDDVRSAFERLDTPDKAAFVFEATLNTIGEAISETGRRFSETISSFDIDDLFRTPGAPAGAPEAGDVPPMPPKRPAPRRRAPGTDPGTPPMEGGPAAN